MKNVEGTSKGKGTGVKELKVVELQLEDTKKQANQAIKHETIKPKMKQPKLPNFNDGRDYMYMYMDSFLRR